MRSVAALAAILVLITGCSRQTRPEGEGGFDDNSKSPEQFRVRLDSSKGPIVIEVTRGWAPRGADRFHMLVKRNFYDQNRFFRVIPEFVAQFGIHALPEEHSRWAEAMIPDDPRVQSNKRGTVTFAMRGPNTRTTQIFINLADNAMLDQQGFAPFGKVVEGMEHVDQLYAGYGEGAPNGNGPAQQMITVRGNAYLLENFPKLDYIQRATVVAQ
jgi:peptidyl-prolyl cis-trans isomerase A (cyclophilin A)